MAKPKRPAKSQIFRVTRADLPDEAYAPVYREHFGDNYYDPFSWGAWTRAVADTGPHTGLGPREWQLQIGRSA